MGPMRYWLLFLACIGLAGAGASQGRFDPRLYQPRVAGERTQVLVLGTPHLSSTPEGWNPAVLEPLLGRLAAFGPDVITIEALSGQSVSALWEYRAVYPDTARSYGGRQIMVAAFGAAGTGLGMAEAEAEARRLLRAWPKTPSPNQRRRLAALFAAAGDPYSALVQWWRLDAAERRPGDGVNAALAAQLAELGTRRNENNLIGSRLAARLGLERVYPVDAQDDDVFTPEQGEMFVREVFEPLGVRLRADPRFRPLIEAAERLRNPEETLATYRMLNRPSTGQVNSDLEWLAMIDRPTKGQIGRVRVAGWEVRNLRMAANVRQAMAAAPGGRVLVIVGSGHKPWLEAYLGMMTDVQIVDAQKVFN